MATGGGMDRRAVLGAAVGVALGVLPARAAPAGALGLTELGRTAATALTGDRLRLDDGREARLAVIEAASPPLDAEPDRRWPLAEAARRALGAFLDGRQLRLWGQSAEPDRYGRLTVHAQRVDDGAWAQEALLNDGHARVRPAPGDDARARALLVAEDAARRGGRGIWATKVYAVRQAVDAGALLRDAGRLTVAEGRPKAASFRNGKTYLDFGEDWRRDFTAAVTPEAARVLKAEGVDARALAGRLLRVRGWPERRFGPQIDVSVAAQLELLD